MYCGAVIQTGPSDDEVMRWMSEAVLYVRGGQLAKAANLLEQVTRTRPQMPDGWANRALVVADLGQFAEALRCIDEAIKLAPTPGPIVELHKRLHADPRAYLPPGQPGRTVMDMASSGVAQDTYIVTAAAELLKRMGKKSHDVAAYNWRAVAPGATADVLLHLVMRDRSAYIFRMAEGETAPQFSPEEFSVLASLLETDALHRIALCSNRPFSPAAREAIAAVNQMLASTARGIELVLVGQAEAPAAAVAPTVQPFATPARRPITTTTKHITPTPPPNDAAKLAIQTLHGRAEEATTAGKFAKARALWVQWVSSPGATGDALARAKQRLDLVVLELAKYDTNAWLAEARTHKAEKDLSSAALCYGELLRLDPAHREALHETAGVTFELGQSALAAKAGVRTAESERWFGQACDCLRKLVQRDPKDAKSWNLLGMSAAFLGRGLEAEEAMARAAALASPGEGTFSVKVTGVAEGKEGAREWLKTGKELGARGETEEATRAYGKAVEADPNLAQAWLARGVGLATLGRGEEAVPCFDRAVELTPQDHIAHDFRGVCLTRLGRAEEGLLAFDRALALAPGNSGVIKHKGAALSVLKRWDAAVELFHAAVSNNPKLVECHLLLGDAHEKNGQPELAVAAYRRFLELSPTEISPTTSKIHQRLAAVLAAMPNGALKIELAKSKLAEGIDLYAQGNFESALAPLNEAQSNNPHGNEAPFYLGCVLKALGKMEGAQRAFFDSLQRNPNIPEPWRNLGSVQLTLGDPEQALTCLDRAIALDPKSDGAWLTRSNILCELLRPADAIESAEKALEISPKNHLAWGNRGRALSMLDRTDEALQAFTVATELGPDEPLHWANRALTLDDLGRLEEATTCVEHCLKLSPEHPLGKQVQARILEKKT